MGTVAASIRDAAGLDACYTLIDRWCERYPWPKNAEAAIRQSVSEVKKRDEDPRLFLGVIGEFSSGKSTFINALLGDALLSTDVLQGTTGVPTLVIYDPHVRVEVLFANGTSYTYPPEQGPGTSQANSIAADYCGLREFIHLCTAHDDLARYVTQVNLFHPAELLRGGLVIVDTPGLNAEVNPHHGQITAQTVKSICDAAVVVTPADMALSRSLLTFLSEHLGDAAHRCIYALTKVDSIRREQERERVVAGVVARLRESLGIERACVLPVAPEIALNLRLGIVEEERRRRRLGEEGISRLVTEFESAKQTLITFATTGKSLIVAERLSRQLSELLMHLTHAFENAERSYEAWQEHLDQTRIPDLDDFVTEQKTRYSQSMLEFQLGGEAELLESLQRQLQTLSQQVAGRIDLCQNKKELHGMQEAIVAIVSEMLNGEVQTLLVDHQKRLVSHAQADHQRFLHDFEEAYESLHALSGNTGGFRKGISEAHHRRGLCGLGDLQSILQDKAKKESIKKNTATIVGGVIGGIVGGGPIGAAIGAGIGRMIAAAIAPSLDEMKSDVKRKSREMLTGTWESSVEPESLRCSRDYAEECIRWLLKEIDRHFNEYDRLVKELIAAGHRERKSVAKMRSTVQADSAEIQSRCEQLNRAVTRFRAVTI